MKPPPWSWRERAHRERKAQTIRERDEDAVLGEHTMSGRLRRGHCQVRLDRPVASAEQGGRLFSHAKLPLQNALARISASSPYPSDGLGRQPSCRLRCQAGAWQRDPRRSSPTGTLKKAAGQLWQRTDSCRGFQAYKRVSRSPSWHYSEGYAGTWCCPPGGLCRGGPDSPRAGWRTSGWCLRGT
jgi:hypothetical protein